MKHPGTEPSNWLNYHSQKKRYIKHEYTETYQIKMGGERLRKNPINGLMRRNRDGIHIYSKPLYQSLGDNNSFFFKGQSICGISLPWDISNKMDTLWVHTTTQ